MNAQWTPYADVMRQPFRLWATVILLVAARDLPAQGLPEYELPPILYSESLSSNQVDRLQQRLASDATVLVVPEEKETLRRCLEALGVSPDTQVLVFSRTSLQRQRIHPRNPRALYFSDDCYVGWVPDGLLEIAVTDPQLGLVFYRFDPRPGPRPHRFERDNECLSCHAGPLTRQWPALIIRSVYPDVAGEPISRAGSFLTDHSSPLSQRWGGWYVTGRHGTARHMGNAVAQEVEAGFELDRETAANAVQLDRWLSTERYLRADSDLVALMVLEHQVTVHNRLAEGALRVRRWMHYQQALQKELGEPVSAEPTGTALRVVQAETQRIVEALLFVDEAPLPEGGITGQADFQTAFARTRRCDREGRSLRDLDLGTRLFRYRCSYLIYSDGFTYLPQALKASVYRALRQGLTAAHPEAPFDRLSPGERGVICSILDTTLPEWSGE